MICRHTAVEPRGDWPTSTGKAWRGTAPAMPGESRSPDPPRTLRGPSADPPRLIVLTLSHLPASLGAGTSVATRRRVAAFVPALGVARLGQTPAEPPRSRRAGLRLPVSGRRRA